MRHSKIFRRADGSRIKVVAEFLCDYSQTTYKVTVLTCEKGKRTWRDVSEKISNRDRYKTRKEREELLLKYQLELVSSEEIMQVKLELWELLNPMLIKEDEL